MAFTKKVVAGQTIAAADFAKFFGDHFSEFVKTGFEVTEGTGLVVDISAGTAYVKDASGYMYQIVSGATETTTLADDSTNYVFLHSDNGATYITDSTSATVPTDAILLATVVTASGDVSTVTDGRNLTPLSPQYTYLSPITRSIAITGSGNDTLNCQLNLFDTRILYIRNIRYSISRSNGSAGDDILVEYSFDNSNFTTLRTGTNIGVTTPIYYNDIINDTSSNTSEDLYIKLTTTTTYSNTVTTLEIQAIEYISYYS